MKDRLLHHVTVTVFQKPEDSETDILHGLNCISPIALETLLASQSEQDEEREHMVHYKIPDIELSVERLPGEDGTIIIYTLFFKRMAWVNAFARKVFGAITAQQRQKYLQQPELLLDLEEKLSVRLDKQSLKSGKITITDTGNCYQVKATVAAYPKNKERILSTIKRMLQSITS